MPANHMNEREFREMMVPGKTLLVDYWAPWCGYCRRIGPAYDRVAAERQDQFPVVKINIDENPALAEAERIEVIPTLILYRDGKVLGSIVAPQSKAQMDDFLRKTLSEDGGL